MDNISFGLWGYQQNPPLRFRDFPFAALYPDLVLRRSCFIVVFLFIQMC